MATEIQVVKLAKSRNVIGSAEIVEFPILDSSISRRHADLSIINKKLMIKDRNSRFGTLI